MPRRLRVRQNPVGSAIGGIVGIVFTLIGIFFVIPHAGAFGVFWTLVAAAGSVSSFYNAFSAEGIADKIIDVPDDPPAAALPSADAGTRLRQLDALKADGLITPAEYDERRAAILAST